MIHKTTRSILSVLLAALLLVTSTPLTPAFADGGAVSPQSANNESRELEQAADGTYLIYTAENLKEFADIVNGTHAEVDRNNSANARLMNDIDLSSVCGESVNDGTSWEPIGNSINQYSGNFNGDGHTISGLYINSTADDQGLFGYVSGSGKVQNLSVSGSVKGDNYVGGVVGYNISSTVENCYNTVTVTGTNDCVGGVVGYNNGGTVENCYNTGEVSGPDSGNSVIDSYVGGVVGQNFGGTVENCYNTGKVSGPDSSNSSTSDVGGVVGRNGGNFEERNRGTVENCYNTGSVSGNSVGGVVGYNYNGGSVTNSYNTGEVSGKISVGGVVGYNHSGGSVTGCYFLKQNPEIPGIGDGNDSADATPVDDLSELCNAFNDTNTWTISDTLKRPVLKDNHEDDGSEQHPYRISTATQLENFRDIVNGANDQAADPDAHAKLMNNIDLSSVCSAEEGSWNPIGTSSKPYSGTFDGNGKTISGLYIDSSDTDYQGLFGYLGTVDQGGTVQNLSVSGSVSVSHGENVGGIVGYNFSGTVTNCAFSGSVGGMFSCSYVGGIVGYNSSGTVTNCAFSGSVSGSVSGNYVGGVVGDNRGSNGVVENCHNAGKVSGSNTVGGVVGYNDGDRVTNCTNTGSVKGSGNSVGGVVGDNDGDSVTNCYFLKTADVNEKLQGIGGGSGTSSNVEARTDDAFHSGEVAWLLQKGQTEGEGGVVPLVWGQSKLGETTFLPTLNPTDEQRVYQVTFDYGDSFAEADDRYDYHYANANDAVTLPTSTDQIPSYDGHTLTGWQNGTTTYQAGEEVEITADTEFTAQWTKDTVNYTVTVSADPEAGGTVNGGGTFAEGTQVTVTATANDGYTFVAWQEGGTKIENAGASYTFTVNDNCTLTAIFEKEPEPTPDPDPTPTPTPDPTPSGPSTGDSTGWDDILDELENTENGDEITIDMGDETKVPAEIFESLAGKDVEISFDLGDIQWSVNGADIPTDTDFTDLDLGVNLGTSGIPVNVINSITGERDTVQMTLAHDGDFGFTMTLTAPLGKENAGYWANLYHYDEDAEALNFEAAAKIDEDGSVTIPFSHASQYAIVIDTHSHATVDVSDLFIDVAPDAWYKDAVQYAYDNGLMTGVSATEFAPEQTTTRAMIVSILARLEGVESAQAAGFADVDDNDWYATAVNWAANVGVVNGYEDNTFKPNTAITREQLAAILMNYAAYKGEDVSNRADLDNYTDQPSTWAQEAMQWAVAEKLITGVTNDELQPQGNATRAQVAAILQRFLSE